jgi:hypothetical protein
MDRVAAKAETVFAGALELSAGAARAQFVAEQCTNDPAVRDEVESLLRAHEEAGGFLLTAAEQKQIAGQRSSTLAWQSTVAMNAAAQAEIFLRNNGADARAAVESFVATLPAALRQEVRERIEAGLRVRQISVRPQPLRPPEEEEAVPHVPGFRIERKLGEGSLGVVYAAHDEKLGRQVALKVLRRPADETVRRRVLDEARKTAGLADPAIVRTPTSGRMSGSIWARRACSWCWRRFARGGGCWWADWRVALWGAICWSISAWFRASRLLWGWDWPGCWWP